GDALYRGLPGILPEIEPGIAAGDFRHGEQLSRALGRRGTNVFMSDDASRWNSVFIAQRLDEQLDALALGRRGRSLFEISHQADADAPLVVIFVGAAGMRSLNLGSPAERGLDGAVGHAVAIADHEVIPDSQPGIAILVFLFQMRRVDALDAPRARGRVMYDNV